MARIPIFETERLLLKPISLDDVPAYEWGFVAYSRSKKVPDVVNHS